MIKVWNANQPVGLIDRYRERGSAFSYAQDAKPANAVSMTMPVRTASWNVDVGIAPIFEMNLPEGALREQIRLAFAKATGSFDDLDILSIVGRSQIGRLRYTAANATALDDDVPFQAIDEILEHKRDGGLIKYLIGRFAGYSGISGVQPKILVRDETDAEVLAGSETRRSTSLRGATHIVKFWERDEYPELAANEFFCLTAAKAANLPVPRFRLSESGDALVIDRFDLLPDGRYLGIEDFCVLNGRGTARKYEGGYEKTLFRRIQDYLAPDNERRDVLLRLFKLFVLNCCLRNGDAHLKNFALIYDDVNGAPNLAPVYDLVTTQVYIANDPMALTLNGTTRWPDAKRLEQIGGQYFELRPRQVQEQFGIIHAGIAQAAVELEAYRKKHLAFEGIGERMLAAWRAGVTQSLECQPGF